MHISMVIPAISFLTTIAVNLVARAPGRLLHTTGPLLPQLLPSVATVSLTPDEPDATTDELVGMAVKDRRRVQLECVGSEFIDQTEAGDYDAALETLQKAAQIKPAGNAALPFRVVPLSALKDLPDPEPLIHGDVIDRGTVTMLAGPSGHGKSFLALDWACSVATGSEWLGNDAVQARVLDQLIGGYFLGCF